MKTGKNDTVKQFFGWFYLKLSNCSSSLALYLRVGMLRVINSWVLLTNSKLNSCWGKFSWFLKFVPLPIKQHCCRNYEMITLLTMSGPQVCPEQIIITVIIIIIMRSTFFSFVLGFWYWHKYNQSSVQETKYVPLL